MPDIWLFLFIGFIAAVLMIDAYRYYLTGKPTLTRAIRAHQMLAFWIGLGVGAVAGHLWWCVCY